MSFKVTKPIVLVGLMGAGKSAIGSIIADKLGVDFVDSDDEIVKAASQSIAEIFERDGEAFFRQKESQVIERLLVDGPMVLSTGGGAFMSAENQEMISNLGITVWLKADLDILWNRVKDKDTRPLLNVDNAYEKLKSLYDLRSPEYAKAAIHVAAEKNQSKEAMRDRVILALLENDASGVKKVEENA